MKRRFPILVAFILLLYFSTAFAGSLFWLERKTDRDREFLISKGIPLIEEFSSGLLAEGDYGLVQSRLDQLAYRSQVLDRNTERSSYAVFAFRSGTSRPEDISSCGEALWSRENWTLLKIHEPMPAGCVEGTAWFARILPRKQLRPAVAPPEEYKPKADQVFTAKPLVQEMVSALTNSKIQTHWSDVVGSASSRYSTGSGCRTAAQAVFNKMQSYHLSPVFQNHTSGHAPNVIGSKIGAVNPDRVYIVIGHLDDLPSSGLAPGADDNASGSALTTLLGEAMSCYAFTNTVKFIAVTGEEFGLYGSSYYADDALARGENIQGVLNGDMVGWQGNASPNPENLDLDYNSTSQWLGELFAQCAQEYGTGCVVDAFSCPSLTASDHAPFWANGWSAVCGITDNEGYCGHGGNYPYYHTSNDTIQNCGNPSFYYGAARAYLATLAHLADPFKITFNKDAVSCNGSLQLMVGDWDLNTNPSVQETTAVQVWSSTEPGPESFLLTEQGTNSMLFSGTVMTTSDPPVGGDGRVSVAESDTVTAQYIDAVACNGSINVSYSDSAGTDCTAPIISNVQSMNVLGSRATITWDTNEAADGTVVYDTQIPPVAHTTSGASGVFSHSIPLTGLTPCTTYYYYVQSSDLAGNGATDNNSGGYYAFETGTDVISTYDSTDVPKPIADSTTVWSVINVPDDKTIVDVDVKLNIRHTWDEDVDIFLISPGGTRIELSTDNGGSGDNYTNTVFDDEAAPSITSGTAPFAGSYRPEGLLSVVDGTSAAGTWKLEVTDDSNQDTGTLISWSLTVTYPAEPCGTRLEYQSHMVMDECSGFGSGGDAIVDQGETVVLPITVHNAGSDAVTGINGTLSTTTTGVTLTADTATFPDIAAGGAAISDPPHFAFDVADTVSCGTNIRFTIGFVANEGAWSDTFTVPVGGPGPLCNPCLSSCPSITLSPPAFLQATIGIPYNQIVSASGGVAPYNYALTAGSLPPGLSMDANGHITGTPTVVTIENFDIAVTDRNGCAGAQSYSITVNCPAIILSPAGLPNGTTGVAYDQAVNASGGHAPYIYTLLSGSLPEGMSLDSAGHISGIPIAVGISSFEVQAADANNCTATKNYSITINCPVISLLPAHLPDGTEGTPFDQTVTAGGGSGPYSFTISNGALPAGLLMDSSGHISGTPIANGTSDFAITATDIYGCAATLSYSIIIGCMYCDEFDDGSLNGWTILKPAWNESNGKLIGVPVKKAMVIARPEFAGCVNCRVETIMESAGGNGNKLWMFGWYIDKKNTVELLMKEGSDKWILKQRVNGKVIAKVNARSLIEPNIPYTVRIEFDGSDFHVLVNNVELLAMAAAAPVTAGTVGFAAASTTGSFEYVHINP